MRIGYVQRSISAHQVYGHLNFKRDFVMLEGPCLNGEAKSVQTLKAK